MDFLAFDVENSVFSCINMPFDEGNAAVADFNAGNAVRVHTATGIIVRRVFAAYSGTVCMTGNQRPVITLCP